MATEINQHLDSTGSRTNNVFSADSNYALFVGQNFKFYSEKWRKILNEKCHGEVGNLRKQSISHVSFNPAALIFGVIWLAYRKMYLTFFLTIASSILLPQVSWVMPILLGLYGNKIYFRFVDKKISNLEKTIENQEILKREIIKSGSTSKFACCAAIVLIIAAISANMIVNGDYNFDGDGISNHVKETIGNIDVDSTLKIKDLVANSAGANGDVKWERKDNNYYITVSNPDYEKSARLGFSHNTKTDYVFLSEVASGDEVCEGVEKAKYCLLLLLKGQW